VRLSDLRNEKVLQHDAYRMAAGAVISEKSGFHPTTISLNTNILKISKSLNMMIGCSDDKETETTIYLAGHIAVSILTGQKLLDADVREQVQRMLFDGRPGMEGEDAEELRKMNFDRVYKSTLDSVRHPSQWGKISELAKCLLKNKDMSEKEIHSALKNAKAKVPDKVSVFDW